MIRSFADKKTQDIFDGVNSKEARKIPRNLWKIARRKFDMLNAAVKIDDLRSPPGNRFEKLSGDLKEFYSIRINDQYRIIFSWPDDAPEDVEIIDYH